MRSKNFPRCGEIWLASPEHSGGCHEYKGLHLYLIVSNNKFNVMSGMVNAIPFSSKRFNRPSPAHVNFAAGSGGLRMDCTLMCENEVSLSNSDLIRRVGMLDEDQMARVAYSVVMQKPIFAFALKDKVKENKEYKDLVNFCA